MFEKEDKVLAAEIVTSFDKIFSETEEINYEDFKNDSLKIQSILIEIESIGNKCKNITGEFRLSNEEVNWDYLIRTRKRLSHKVLSAVNTDIIWTLIKKDYPSIKTNIQKLISE